MKICKFISYANLFITRQVTFSINAAVLICVSYQPDCT